MTKQLSKEIMQRSRCQHSNIPIKIIKDNLEIFPDFLCTNINSFFKSSSFPSCLKMADVTSLHKKGKKNKKTTGQLVFFQCSQKYLKEACLYKCLVFYQKNNVASREAIVHNNVFWLC